MKQIVKILLIFHILFLNFNYSFAKQQEKQELSSQSRCEQQEGLWKNFGNGCADSCFKYENERVMCTMAFVWACDCGEGSCYDSELQKCREILIKN